MLIKESLQTKAKYKDTNTIEGIIIHHTWTSVWTGRAVANNASKEWAKTAYHYVIDGKDIYKVGNDTDSLRHTGNARRPQWVWDQYNSLNTQTIWIEVTWPNGKWWFDDDTVETLKSLVCELANQYKIKSSNILRHSDIAIPVWRKTDIANTVWKDRWFVSRESFVVYLLWDMDEQTKSLIQSKIFLNSWLWHTVTQQSLKDRLHEENNFWKSILGTDKI